MNSTPPRPEPLRPRTGTLTAIFLGVVALGWFGAAVLGSNEPSPDPIVGSVAPEVVGDLFDGTTWRLSDHLAEDGRPVVLNLWASWCLPCRDEIPELSTFADSHPDWLVVGIAVDDREPDARALADELRPVYPLGIDATGRLREQYSAIGMPLTVVIDPTGIITHRVHGGITATELESIVG